jgi:transcriptional regulator with XRE-family HTH domain
MPKKQHSKSAPPPEIEVGLGRSLAILRSARNLNQSDLSRLSGVQRSSIWEYEEDKSIPDAATLQRLLRALRFGWTALDLAGSFLTRLAAEGRRHETDGYERGKQEDLLQAVTMEISNLGSGLDEIAQSADHLKELIALLERQGERVPYPEAVLDYDPEKAAEDRRRARAFWTRLRKLPPAVQRQRVREDEGWAKWALCELLCLESQRLCAVSPDKAARLALLAVDSAEREEDHPRGWRSKLLGFAFGHMANVLRSRGELKSASRMFVKTRRHWTEGRDARKGLLDEGLVDALEASLRRDERKFGEALELLDSAWQRAGSPRLKLQVAVSKAKTYEESGDLEKAVAVLEDLAKLEVSGDPHLALCIHHNLADNLSKIDRFREADAILPNVRTLSRRVGGAIDRVRLMWTEGRIAAGLGKVEEGIGILAKVRGEFASREMHYDTALVSLELAVLYAKEGKPAEVKALARHMVPVFQSQDVHREALAALALFRQAAEAEKATEELARGILAYLQRARFDPGLKFAPDSVAM